MSFESKVIKDGSSVRVSFSGPIDENVSFPDLSGESGELVIDLEGVKYINSIGIKMWIQWISPFAEAQKIKFEKCPKAIVLQINMVKSFLPTSATVLSFQLPLYCEACDSESSLLLNTSNDVEITNGEVKIKADLSSCPACGANEVEIDIIPKKYFRFLLEPS